MTAASLPVWRSLLFVPATAKRFVDGAARRSQQPVGSIDSPGGAP